VTASQSAPTPLEALLTRLRATDAEARRILGSAPQADLPPLETPKRLEHVHAAEMPEWSDVELELSVTDEMVTFVGRDLVTGRPRIKVQLSKDDATEEWIPWLRRWLEKKRRGSLHLVE
jgi:hypothetical protein